MDSEQGEASGSRAVPLQEFSQIVLNLFNKWAQHSLLLADSRFSYLSLFMAYIFGIVKGLTLGSEYIGYTFSFTFSDAICLGSLWIQFR